MIKQTPAEILEFIRVLRECHSDLPRAGLFGKCMRVSRLLTTVFGGEPLYDGCHVITQIGGRYYDITGEVPCGGHHKAMTQDEQRRALSWDVRTDAEVCEDRKRKESTK